MVDGFCFHFCPHSQSNLPPPHQTLPPHPQPLQQQQPVPVHPQPPAHAQSNGSGFQQMARMMDSLILDNFGPFAFTKITTSHHTHRLPSRASNTKRSAAGSTTHLPQTGHATTANPPSQTMRINMHRNSTSNVMGAKVAYNHHHGEWKSGSENLEKRIITFD